jgi:hypothetical protein
MVMAMALATEHEATPPPQHPLPSNQCPPTLPRTKRLFDDVGAPAGDNNRRKVGHSDQHHMLGGAQRSACLAAMVTPITPTPTTDAIMTTDFKVENQIEVSQEEFELWWAAKASQERWPADYYAAGFGLEDEDNSAVDQWQPTQGGPTEKDLESLPSGSAPPLLSLSDLTSPTHHQYVNTVSTTQQPSLDDVLDITLSPTVSFTSLGSLGSLDSKEVADFFAECFGDNGEQQCFGDSGDQPVFGSDGELTHAADHVAVDPEYMACLDPDYTGDTAQQVAIDMGLGAWVGEIQVKEEHLQCTEVYPLTPPTLKSPPLPTPLQASNDATPDAQAAAEILGMETKKVCYCSTDDEVYYVKTEQRKSN